MICGMWKDMQKKERAKETQGRNSVKNDQIRKKNMRWGT